MAAGGFEGDTLCQKVSSQLTCSVCFERFNEPKTLTCLHSFCLECLKRLQCNDLWNNRGRNGVDYIRCPTCRKYSSIPSGGIARLPTAFYLNSLKDELQKAESKSKAAGKCSVHPTEERRIFCNECQELLCINCALSTHRNHNYDLMENVHQASLDELQSNLYILEKGMDKICRLWEKTTIREGEINNLEKSLKNEVNDFTKKMIDLIKQSQSTKLKQIDKFINRKMQAVFQQKSSLKRVNTKQKNLHERIVGITKTKDIVKLLSEKKSVIKEVETTASFDYTSYDKLACEKDNIKFVENVSLLEKINSFGYFLLGDVNYQVRYNISLSGRRGTVSLYNSAISLDHFPKLTCTLTSPSNQVTLCEVGKENRDGISTISFVPTTRGEHLLNIRIEDINVEKCFSIQVYPSPEIRTRFEFTQTNFHKPTGIDFIEDSYIIVEKQSNCVSMFYNENNVTKKYNFPISFVNPWAVATTKNGKIFVTDEHRLVKFDFQRIIASVGGPKKGIGDVCFNTPKGMAIHPVSHDVFVADSGNNRIVVFDENLVFVLKFGSKGTKLGSFYQPTDLVFSKSGNQLFIVNHYAHGIDVFTPSGQPLRRIGASAKELNYPMAITIDTFNYLYITEVESSFFSVKPFRESRISVYRTDGTFVCCIGQTGMKDFCNPCGIAVDKIGNICVCDTDNDRLINM